MTAPERGEGAAGSDEFALIARYFAPLSAAEAGAFGLGDDAAVLAAPPGCDAVVTCDTVVEGVHFRPEDPADSVGVKALAVNLSDLAAMGARPAAYLLSAALPSAWDGERRHAFLGGFTRGLAGLQRRYAITLVGGDTVATQGPLCLTVTALGWVASGRALRRAGARPGDVLFVSGSIGDAGLGLAALKGELAGISDRHVAELIDRYRRPRPRVELGCRLDGIARAAIDVSDGLIADLGHLCRQSGVSARLTLDSVPLSAAARAVVGDDEARRAALLAMGDDYELVFAVPPERASVVGALAADLALPISGIGVIGEPSASGGTDIAVLGRDGRRLVLDHRGYRHF